MTRMLFWVVVFGCAGDDLSIREVGRTQNTAANATREETEGEVIGVALSPDKQTPDEQTPDEQTPDEQTPEETRVLAQAPEEQAPEETNERVNTPSPRRPSPSSVSDYHSKMKEYKKYCFNLIGEVSRKVNAYERYVMVRKKWRANWDQWLIDGGAQRLATSPNKDLLCSGDPYPLRVDDFTLRPLLTKHQRVLMELDQVMWGGNSVLGYVDGMVWDEKRGKVTPHDSLDYQVLLGNGRGHKRSTNTSISKIEKCIKKLNTTRGYEFSEERGYEFSEERGYEFSEETVAHSDSLKAKWISLNAEARVLLNHNTVSTTLTTIAGCDYIDTCWHPSLARTVFNFNLFNLEGHRSIARRCAEQR